MLAARGTLGVFLATTTSTAAGTGAEELEILAHHAELAALLAGGLVLPTVELETALDVDRAALLAVLAGDLGLTAPEGHVDEGRLLALLATLGGVDTVHGDAEIGDRASLGGVFDFGVTGDIPDQHHFVEVGHRSGEERLKVFRLKTIR